MNAQWNAMEQSQNAANAQPGPRSVPARVLPIPPGVNPAAQALIAAPYRVPQWNADPPTVDAWRTLVADYAETVLPFVARLREELRVTMTATVLGGVSAFLLTPEQVPENHRKHLLVNLHGGAYVFGPGESGTTEAILMAAYGRYNVLAVDYRMPPDAPYPAAVEDALAVYQAVLETHHPSHVAFVGTSAGGSLILAMLLRARAQGLPMPAAIAPGTPMADLTGMGDSYHTNEWVDNVLVSYDGFCRRAALLYANGEDLQNPELSPVYADFDRFPPALLTTGTRDLFLSNTVRTHRKLRQAGVEAELHVFEGLSHAQYLADPHAPDTKETFAEITRFFDSHLAL